MTGFSLAGLLAPALAGALAVAGAFAVAGALASPAAAQPSPSPPVTIDSPSPDIMSLNGLSVARDGTGGLVYLKAIGGVPRVFVSALVGGQFQAPIDIDTSLAGASSQPVIAAGNGGVLLIAFVNSGGLYVVDRSNASAGFGAPAGIAGGGVNPSIQMSNLGKAYLAFTVPDGGGHDVRTAYYANGNWALEAPALNAVAAADDAGAGTGAPAVATAGDGVAIVTWGEGGHVYSRRVWGTAPSAVAEQADPGSFAGCGEVSAGEPAVSSGGDSSYADVAFQELLQCGAVQQARVLVNRLHGSRYDGAAPADAGDAGAGDPAVAMTEYGQGFVTAEGQGSHNAFAMDLGNNGAPGSVLQINTLPGVTPPDPVPAIAGLFSDLIAWQQDPGSTGPAEIRVRYEPRASTLGPEMVVSSPGQGPTDAARGLAAGGDAGGDAAVAWVQGTGASTQIVAERLYQPPAAPAPASSITYSRSAQPVLSWSASGGRWGPITYTVIVNGTAVGQTAAAAFLVPSPLRDGPSSWSVNAANPAGLTSASKAARVFVDTVAPSLSAALSGARRAGALQTLRLSYRDGPPRGLPARDASGVAALIIHWGDGTTSHVKPGTHRILHTYRRAGRYRITVTATDRAGNRRSVVRRVNIAAASAKGKSKGHG